MAHVVIEYSGNLRDRIDFPAMLGAVHSAALETGVFPVGGLRTRAYEAAHYRIADGHPDNAFVHVMLRVGHGRDLAVRKCACDVIFAALCGQLAALFTDGPLAISLEMQEIDPVLTLKRNNLHDYVKTRAAAAS